MNGRRHVVLAAALGALVTLVARAQPDERVRRIGILSLGEADKAQEGRRIFRELLLRLGYEEGRNLLVERRYAELDVARLDGLAKELVQRDVELILAVGNDVVAAAQRATRTIPIVMTGVVVPVELGFVASLARPGANITGTTGMSPETSNKIIQLLKEAAPNAARVAILHNPTAPGADRFRAENIRAASALEMTVSVFDARLPEQVGPALARIAESGADALYVPLDPVVAARFAEIAGFALRHRLLSIASIPPFALAGGTLAYGPDGTYMGQRTASYIDRILRGAQPAELPVEQPTKFNLVVNLKTARAIGLTIPQSLLLRADEVIR